MPETENIEQIDGHGTPKVDAVIPDSRLVSYAPLLGVAAGVAALWSIKTRLNAKFVIGSTAIGTATSLPMNWIISETCDIIYHLTETAVGGGGAPKVDAVVPDRRAVIGVHNGTLDGYIAGLTPRANIVIPELKGATLLGAFLGSSIGLVTGTLPSTRTNLQDFEKWIDERLMLKKKARSLMEKKLMTSMQELKNFKEFPRAYGSVCGGMMGGVFVGSYCGLHNFIAKKRGVEDAYNHLAANLVAITTVKCLPHLSTHNRNVNMMRAFVGGWAIALVHLKKVNSND